MIDLTVEQTKIVLNILKEHVDGKTVWAFGSRVKGGAVASSDLDLVIVDNHPMDLSQLFKLKDAFEFSVLPFRVDVLDWARISPEFREQIKNRYEVLN